MTLTEETLRTKNRCRDNPKRKEIVSEENRNKHIAHNDSGSLVRHFHVDGDILPKGERPERCDFLLLDDTKKNAYYIELKGSPSNAQKCLRQVRSTENLFRPFLQGYKSLYRFVYGTGQGKNPNRQKAHFGGTEREIIDLRNSKILIDKRLLIEEKI